MKNNAEDPTKGNRRMKVSPKKKVKPSTIAPVLACFQTTGEIQIVGVQSQDTQSLIKVEQR